MIIEKTYDFDYIPSNFIGMLSDYHKNIITDINRQFHHFLLKGEAHPVVAVGIEGYLMMGEQSAFIYAGITTPQSNNYKTKIGYLINTEVYYDLRLKNDEIIIGSNESEIDYHICVRQRKEKLLKIKNAVNISKNSL